MDEKQRILDVYIDKLQLAEQIPGFEAENFQDLSQLDEYGIELHSLMVLEIIIGLEEAFDIQFDESSITPEILKDMTKIRELLHREET